MKRIADTLTCIAALFGITFTALGILHNDTHVTACGITLTICAALTVWLVRKIEKDTHQ